MSLPVGCSNEEAECPDSGRCILRSSICDSFVDCGNGWDEQNCSKCLVALFYYHPRPRRNLTPTFLLLLCSSSSP